MHSFEPQSVDARHHGKARNNLENFQGGKGDSRSASRITACNAGAAATNLLINACPDLRPSAAIRLLQRDEVIDTN